MPGMKTMRDLGFALVAAVTAYGVEVQAQQLVNPVPRVEANTEPPKGVTFLAPTPYLSVSDSPFFGDGRSCHALENFQAGRATVQGFSFVGDAGAAVVSPGGVVDPGITQYALSGTNSLGTIALQFHEELLGQLPNRVGFVWTRGYNGSVTLKTVNARGRAASQTFRLNSPNLPGNPADDLFFGVNSDVGISSLVVSFSPPMFCEIDHVQFSLPSADSDGDGAMDCVDSCPNDRANRCRVRGDANGDGVPDVFVQDTSTRAVSLWTLGGDGAISATRNVAVPAAGFVPAGYGDFGADGFRELLMQNANARQLTLWTLGGADGATLVRTAPILAANGQPFSPASNWIVQGTADFDGDGQLDILARDSGTGVMNVWRMNGRTVASTPSLAAVPSNPAWIIGGVIEGPTPGTTRIFAQNRVNRRIIVWNMNGFSPAGSSFVTDATGAYVQLPVGASLVGLQRFGGDAAPSLLVRSSAGKVDRWRLDAQNRYLRGSAVTPDNRGAVVPRAD